MDCVCRHGHNVSELITVKKILFRIKSTHYVFLHSHVFCTVAILSIVFAEGIYLGSPFLWHCVWFLTPIINMVT